MTWCVFVVSLDEAYPSSIRTIDHRRNRQDPIGIPTHAADPHDPYPSDALRIVQRQTGLAYLGMHQRLDADTSGVLLFSARPEANRGLAAAFEGRAVRKVYLALVRGAPRPLKESSTRLSSATGTAAIASHRRATAAANPRARATG